MKAKYNHLPLKAYEVYSKYGQGFLYHDEYSFGVVAGHTAGQARYQVALNRELDNPWKDLRSRRVHGPEAERAIEAFQDQGKYWKNTGAFARLQAQADAWNAAYPVGHPVLVRDCGEASTWPNGQTVTRTPAWVPSLSGVLVSLEGHCGGFGLEYLTPLES